MTIFGRGFEPHHPSTNNIFLRLSPRSNLKKNSLRYPQETEPRSLTHYCWHRVRLLCFPPLRTVDDSYKHPPARVPTESYNVLLKSSCGWGKINLKLTTLARVFYPSKGMFVYLSQLYLFAIQRCVAGISFSSRGSDSASSPYRWSPLLLQQATIVYLDRASTLGGGGEGCTQKHLAQTAAACMRMAAEGLAELRWRVCEHAITTGI